MNLRRLGFDKNKIYAGGHVYGSTLGMTRAEISYIKASRFHGRFFDNNYNAQTLDVLSYLREAGILLDNS